MNKTRLQVFFQAERIPFVFLFIQLGLSLYEKRGWSVPVEMCPISLELYCCDVDLITPYCTSITVYDYAFLFTVFFLTLAYLLWKTRKKSLILDGIYWLVLAVYAGAAWFTEFHGPNLNSQLYLAFLRWITLTYFNDPLNFSVFLLMAACFIKGFYTLFQSWKGGNTHE